MYADVSAAMKAHQRDLEYRAQMLEAELEFQEWEQSKQGRKDKRRGTFAPSKMEA